MNQGKTSGKGRKITGICLLAFGVIALILGFVMYSTTEGSFGILPEELCGSIACIIIGFILLFVNLRGYGWLIAAVLFVGVIISNAMEGNFDSGFVGSIALAVVSLGLLLYSNLKK